MTLAQILQGSLQCAWHQWGLKNLTPQEPPSSSVLGQTETKPGQQGQGSRPGPAIAFPQLPDPATTVRAEIGSHSPPVPHTPTASPSFYRCESQRGAGPPSRARGAQCTFWEDTGGQHWQGWRWSPSAMRGCVCVSGWFQGSLRGGWWRRCYLQQPLPWEDRAKAAPKALETPHIPLPSHPPRVLPSPQHGCHPAGVPAGRWHSLCGAVTTHEPSREHTTRLPRGSGGSSGTGIIPRLHPAAFPQVLSDWGLLWMLFEGKGL